jgi:hypothetical protein
VIAHRQRRTALWGVCLALLLQAYVPAGFMPAAGAPGLLMLCPTGLPAALLGHLHHHHPDGHAGFEHCPFGSAPAGTTGAPPIAIVPPERLAFALPPPAPTARLGIKPARAHRARAPPPLESPIRTG